MKRVHGRLRLRTHIDLLHSYILFETNYGESGGHDVRRISD